MLACPSLVGFSMHSQRLEAPEARLGLTARHEMRSSCPHITISSSDGIALGAGLRLSVKT